ncbi:competence protein CoiA [Bavariicoccus seileri]|uniref:competence protein CoiA n=1 Tax=Bavariicoccus seileri TaxID=549685 RepID=UPI003F8EC6CF
MLIAKTAFGSFRHADAANDRETYYCPYCGEVVILRSGQKTKRHFAHRPIESSTSKVAESFEHKIGKMWLADQFNEIGYAVSTEAVVSEAQRADILVSTAKSHVVIEYQLSPISLREISLRSVGYRSLGLNQWWFVGQEDLPPVAPQQKLFLLMRYHEKLGYYYWVLDNKRLTIKLVWDVRFATNGRKLLTGRVVRYPVYFGVPTLNKILQLTFLQLNKHKNQNIIQNQNHNQNQKQKQNQEYNQNQNQEYNQNQNQNHNHNQSKKHNQNNTKKQNQIENQNKGKKQIQNQHQNQQQKIKDNKRSMDAKETGCKRFMSTKGDKGCGSPDLYKMTIASRSKSRFCRYFRHSKQPIDRFLAEFLYQKGKVIEELNPLFFYPPLYELGSSSSIVLWRVVIEVDGLSFEEFGRFVKDHDAILKRVPLPFVREPEDKWLKRVWEGWSAIRVLDRNFMPFMVK